MYVISNEILQLTSKETFKFSRTFEQWKESNTIYIKYNDKWLVLAEIQVHNHIDCLKCRFDFDMLALYLSNVQVYNLKLKYNLKTSKGMPKDVKVFQTLNYIGSKTNLLNYIGETIEEYMQKKLKDIQSFLDPFSGIGVVSYYLLQNGCKNVISNDIQHYAYIVSSIWATTDINMLKN